MGLELVLRTALGFLLSQHLEGSRNEQQLVMGLLVDALMSPTTMKQKKRQHERTNTRRILKLPIKIFREERHMFSTNLIKVICALKSNVPTDQFRLTYHKHFTSISNFLIFPYFYSKRGILAKLLTAQNVRL